MKKPTYYETVELLVGVGNLKYGRTDGPLSEIHFVDGVSKPSEKAIQAKLAKLQAEYDAQAYSRKREAEYPSVQECVHAILDDTLDALQAKRASIKTKYPKGG